MIKNFTFTITLLLLAFSGISQDLSSVQISEMKWGADFNIHITFSNDSSSIMDVKGLYHSESTENYSNSEDVTYYPVSLDDEFINSLKDRNIESFIESEAGINNESTGKSSTLWSATHDDIGGGWIHFINCLVYTIESTQLNLAAPLMMRPESNWKPKPITESYKRTKKWSYYIPETQKLAHKEYKAKKSKNELGDINFLPPYFIELFLTTKDKDYALLEETMEFNKLAIINMIRLLLGSNYLGQEQIDYIQSAVKRSMAKYTINSLPSVIIFDDFEAAVAMTLNDHGYSIKKIVFNNEGELSADEISQRTERMEGIIKHINEVNKKVFEKNLKEYYN